MAKTFSTHNDKGIQRIIEHKLEIPIFFIVTFMQLVREAQPLSGNAFILSDVLGRFFTPFMIINGLGLAVGSTLLFTIAGRNYRTWRAERTDIELRTGMTKTQRYALISAAIENQKISFTFMVAGGIIAIYNGMSFLRSNTLKNGFSWSALLSDFMSAFIMIIVVAYIGIFREKRKDDSIDNIISELDVRMNSALFAAVERFQNGTHTDVDTEFIIVNLPPQKQAAFRRATTKADKSRMWTVTQIRTALGLADTTANARTLNREINALAQKAENGIHKPDGSRRWAIPHRVVMEYYGERIAMHTVEQRIANGQGTDTVQTVSTTQTPEIPAMPTISADSDTTPAHPDTSIAATVSA